MIENLKSEHNAVTLSDTVLSAESAHVTLPSSFVTSDWGSRLFKRAADTSLHHRYV